MRCVGIAIVLSAFAALAQAERTAADDYQGAIDAALSEYAARNFEEARVLFMRAHTQSPNARTLRGLGMAEFELRNYPAAIRYLQRALAATVKPLDGELRQRTSELLARAQSFVGEVSLFVEPEDATLELDGAEIAGNDVLVLSVGEHVLTVRAQNRRSVTKTLKVRGGEQQTVRVSLVPLVSVREQEILADPRSPTDRDETSKKRRRRWIGTSVAVVTAAGLGVALALALRPKRETISDEGDLGSIIRAKYGSGP